MKSGEWGFGIVVPTDTDCPADYSKGNRQEVMDLKVKRDDLCLPEVRTINLCSEVERLRRSFLLWPFSKCNDTLCIGHFFSNDKRSQKKTKKVRIKLLTRLKLNS